MEKPKGTLFVVGLDQLSMDSLAKRKGMELIVSKAVFFKIGKARVGKAQEEKINESVGSEDEKKNKREAEIPSPTPKKHVYWRNND